MDWILDIKGEKPIDPTKFFGKDTDRMYEACKKVLYNVYYPYEGCYTPPNLPTLREVMEEVSNKMSVVPSFDCFTKALYNVRRSFYKEHPEELEAVETSKKMWEVERDKQFGIIYKIAKRHNIELEWYGENKFSPQADMWVISQNEEPVARIYI